VSAAACSWDDAFPAPAKLNLFLHVVGRRADGYHLLQSAFRLLDLADTLRFAPRPDGSIRRTTPLPGVPEEADLAVRAARLLQQEGGCRLGADIHVEKRLPLGGGLGGGSSDAATTLLALNRLWGLHFPRVRLQELGLRLGADVPFFVFGRSAFAEGVGERLQALELPPAWYAVVQPEVTVPTAEIFAAANLTRDTKPIKISDFSAGWGKNDLEPVACGRYPAVAQAIAWLGRFGDARMSGSGACVFAPFATERQARAVLERLPEGMRGWVARGIDEHPLRPLAD
jgi:4-diphosphocytidyl-2-C-methyl-D-erythritol kinase